MTRETLKKEAQRLPLLPGVYLMRDALDNIIYIGKSKALKNRVSSYFNSGKKPSKVERMVRHIAHFEVHYTDTELDALLLECKLIKMHRPIYNRLLKQGNRYCYLYLNTNEPRPRIRMVRDQTHEGFYFGPYEKGHTLYHTVQEINAFYTLPDCKWQEIQANCLTYKRGKCLGPCQKPYDEEAFKKQLEAVCHFLEGEELEIISHYKRQMEEAALKLDFEQAMRHKATWEALKSLHFKQEAMEFAMSSRITLLKQPCPRGGEKLWVWLGAKKIWSKVIQEPLESQELDELLEEVIETYTKKSSEPLLSLRKEEIDEVQILYSMLKKQSEKYLQSFMASDRLKKDQERIKEALRELLG